MELVGDANSPPTGLAITSSGDIMNPVATDVLTADTSALSDSNGLPSSSDYEYQWTQADLDGSNQFNIPGATSQTYTMTASNLNKRIGVTVRFEDDRCYRDAATAFIGPDAQAGGDPMVSVVGGGRFQVGETLTANPSTITDADGTSGATFTYQWQREETSGAEPVDIAGATSQTYVLQTADGDKQVRVRVRFTDDRGNNEVVDGRLISVLPENRPAAGLTFDGDLYVTGTLTADPPAIMDADGTSGATFTYQWQREETSGAEPVDIAGATSQSYVLQLADQGKRVRVRVRFTDDNGNPEEPVSDLSELVEAEPNNDPTGPPTIDGTTEVGATLRARTGGIDDPDGTSGAVFTYQWQREETRGVDPVDISGATSSTYVLQETDQGKRVRVRVRFTDDKGNSERLDSDLTAVVAAGPNVSATAPAVGGTPQVGRTLTADPSTITDANGRTGATFTYQWQREERRGALPVDIAGATSQTYVLQEADQGRRVRVRVSFTDDDGYPEAPVSDLRGPVAQEDNEPATAPTVGGTAQVGQTLTADPAAITDANGRTRAVFTYQWQREETTGAVPVDIAGARSRTYVLQEADQGKRVRVRVRFTDDDGNPEAPVSDLTGTVVPEENTPATGSLTISDALPGPGVRAQVGAPLTAEAEDVDDVNGRTRAVFAYQWQREDLDGSNREDISGATSETYTPQAGDEGKRVRVRLGFTDDDGNPEALVSEFTDAVLPPNTPAAGDLMPTAPSVQVLQTMRVDPSVITDADGLTRAQYAYQWQREETAGADPVDIPGATSRTYMLQEPDQGRRVRVRVRFTDDNGNSEELVSDLTVVVSPEPNVESTGFPQIGGRARVGGTLRADTSGIRDPNGLTRAQYAYQWQSVAVELLTGAPLNPPMIEDIAGATSQTYTLREADLGTRVRVRVRFRDDDGNPQEEKFSDHTDVVAEALTVHEDRIKEWMALFGRTVSVQVLDAVERRLQAPVRTQGEMALAGRRVRWTPGHGDDTFARSAAQAWFGSEDPRDWLDVLSIGDEESLLGSSFSLTRGTAGSGFTSLWGQGAYASFASREADAELEGGVTMGQFGADWSFGPWKAGLSVAHSDGEGEYWDEGQGDIESTLLGIYPYAGYEFSEQLLGWAMAGYGRGDLKIAPENGDAVETDIALTMGGAGVRSDLLTVDTGAAGELSVAVKADAALVRMESEAVEDLGVVESRSSRVRLGLEAAGRTELGQGGATLAPVSDLGVLYEGGDAGKGAGMDVGVGLGYADPSNGLSADFRGRFLVLHSGSGKRDWGVSGGVRYETDPLGSRGLSVSLDGGYGGRSTSGGMDALFDRYTVEEMGGGGEGGDAPLPGGRVGAEVGYGLRAFENRYATTPKASLGLTETGSTWGLGWWLTPSAHGAPDLRGGIELNGREDGDRTIGLRLGARF